MTRCSRRRMLGLGAIVLGAGPLAGCAVIGSGQAPSDPGPQTRGTSAQASFFVFGDFAAHVAGAVATAETVVPIGQHGHGWEPGPRVREAILQADLFVYGTSGFQPWADDVVRDLGGDGQAVTVVEAGDGVDLLDAGDVDHDDHDDDHEGVGYDHASGADPHFWLDPLRAIRAVDNVHGGFVDVDADNADAYESNAATYRDWLGDLHETVETTLVDRSSDVVLVAGHDAFGYLQDRYGFEVEALTGIAPDDHPSPRDIERAQRLIEEHDLEYICADPLESQRAAEQLVAETDARAVLPLTSMPGRTQAWQDDKWGYLDIMEHVNLPTLERALHTS